ncbi:DNA polymerase III subunit delta' [Paenibacillus senegalensis]|uniref:DNA polymerase III subunit delta' n=1 Tax=Paenibacillus senegalensis TaxID=1465766 RepID=UPI000287B432|nr:DNA polymerase III subunit delta' [Paenibacillus senegalensis]
MSFQAIAGQEHVKRVLQNGLRSGKLSHAYIFSGPAGSGRKRTAMALVKAIYCSGGQDEACGQCLECRKLEHGNQPGLLWIEPDGASIKIEQIRELQKGMAYRSTTNDRKIYVLNEAEKMTVQAANSLLKFLEEPTSDVMAILITENGHALLPTIISRAQWLSFTPMNASRMAEILQEEGLPGSLVLPAVHLTAGVEAARELVSSNWFGEARKVMLQLAQETLANLPSAMISLQKKVIKSDLNQHLGVFIDLWILWLKDMVRLQCGQKDRLLFIDQLDWMERQANSRDSSFWIACMEQAVDMQKRIRFNANGQLTLEKWMIDLRGG